MASNTVGIQQLIKAEREAADTIAEARKKKTRRLKEAKDQAQAEIDAYRKQREKQFKEQEQRIIGSKSDMEATIDQDTRQKISAIEARVQQHKEASIIRLLEMVSQIQPEVHVNFKPVGKAG